MKLYKENGSLTEEFYKSLDEIRLNTGTTESKSLLVTIYGQRKFDKIQITKNGFNKFYYLDHFRETTIEIFVNFVSEDFNHFYKEEFLS